MASLPTGPFDNAQAIYRFLIGIGLTPNAAAGVAGNIYQESHGNPAITGSGGGGLFGLTGSGGGSLTEELHSLVHYINQNGSVADINAHASSPSAAAQYFSNKYERPGSPNMSIRIAAADWVSQAARSGNWGSGVSVNAPPSGKGGTLKEVDAALNAQSGFGYLGNFVSGFSGVATGVADVGTALAGFSKDVGLVIHWVSWFAYPAHWVRLLAGFTGVIFLVFAGIALVWAAK